MIAINGRRVANTKPVKRAAASHCRVRNALASIALAPILAGTINAATLKPETAQAWDRYVQAASAEMQRRLVGGVPFLWIDESPDRAGTLRAGGILVTPGEQQVPRRVPFGLIHHWIGSIFLANATIDEVLTVERDYAHYKDFYKPVVLDCKAIGTSPSDDRFTTLLMNRSLVSKMALESDYKSDTFHVDHRRAYAFTRSTRIQEIENYGSPHQRILSQDEGAGFIWRYFSITRYQQRDGGVFMEVETMVLSRDIPATLRWMVDPIVRRASRESLITSLKQTGDAVESRVILSRRNGLPPGGGAAAAARVRAKVQ
jgi:hypothetical protein